MRVGGIAVRVDLDRRVVWRMVGAHEKRLEAVVDLFGFPLHAITCFETTTL